MSLPTHSSNLPHYTPKGPFRCFKIFRPVHTLTLFFAPISFLFLHYTAPPRSQLLSPHCRAASFHFRQTQNLSHCIPVDRIAEKIFRFMSQLQPPLLGRTSPPPPSSALQPATARGTENVDGIPPPHHSLVPRANPPHPLAPPLILNDPHQTPPIGASHHARAPLSRP